MRTPVRHGECILLPVESIPAEAEKVFTGQEHIVAHSESGHHHVLVGGTGIAVAAFKTEKSNFVHVAPGVRIEHRKTGKDAHRTLDIAPGAYEIRAKTEFDYTENLRREVRD